MTPQKKEDWLEEKMRAEDILLGSLGLADDAKLKWIKRTTSGFHGEAQWSDGEVFPIESEDEELTELELWAIEILST